MEVQSFLRRFIVAFVEIVKYINDMLGKDKEIKWTPEAKQYFEDINKAIYEALCTCKP